MKTPIKQLVFASHNEGKIAEISDLMTPLGIEVIPQGVLGIHEADETGSTFIENALIKAKHAAKISSLPALADDSGLVVPALGGAPGIYSARYAQIHPDLPPSDAQNNAKLLAEMKNQTDRRALFVCLMVLCFSDTHPLPLVAEGYWQGEIAKAAQGKTGFGYDPLFYLPTLGLTVAALEQTEKNRLSHRGQALQNLLKKLL